jgi:3-hydroxyacyl-CoA dehydrogenase / 3-hydroxy-2-methylbutyryl-CoA dehydrogenase
MRIDGSVTLVTGGASGLGRATAAELILRGGRVAILDVAGPRGEETAAELGPDASFIAADVSDAQALETAVGAAVERYGRLDALVSAAALAPRGRILNRAGRPYPLVDFRRTLEVNLVGAWNVARLCALQMIENEPNDDGERGAIVNVASIAGIEGAASQTAYVAAKAGLIGLTLPMARDLAHWGIRVNAIAPGTMATPIIADAPPDYMEELQRSTLFPPRFGHPDEFAALTLHLLENALVNAEVVRLDAGTRMAAWS